MIRTFALSGLLFAATMATAAERVVPPNPLDDPLKITAGFLNHHQDIKYRMLGIEHYKKKSYEKALMYFRRASFYADKPSQGMVAEMYWKGEGVPRDPVQAYVWMDLAAERGYRGFTGLRESYWKSLSEAERSRAVAEGQAVYARFGDAAAKPRYEWELRKGKRDLTGSRTGFNRGVQIQVPGPAGMQAIPGSKFYDERYWDAEKYWAWQDKVWMKPRIVTVTIGDVETVTKDEGSRIPETAPEVDAQAPEVDEAMPTPDAATP
jgi:Sel1 repeat